MLSCTSHASPAHHMKRKEWDVSCDLSFGARTESHCALHTSLAKIEVSKSCWQSRVGGSCGASPLPSIPSEGTVQVIDSEPHLAPEARAHDNVRSGIIVIQVSYCSGYGPFIWRLR